MYVTLMNECNATQLEVVQLRGELLNTTDNYNNHLISKCFSRLPMNSRNKFPKYAETSCKMNFSHTTPCFFPRITSVLPVPHEWKHYMDVNS